MERETPTICCVRIMTGPQPSRRAAMKRTYIKRRIVVGIPIALAIVMVVNIVVAVVGPPAGTPSAASVSKARLASLLLPASGSLTFHAAHAETRAETAADAAAAAQRSSATPRSAKHGEAYREAPAEDVDLVPSS